MAEERNFTDQFKVLRRVTARDDYNSGAGSGAIALLRPDASGWFVVTTGGGESTWYQDTTTSAAADRAGQVGAYDASGSLTDIEAFPKWGPRYAVEQPLADAVLAIGHLASGDTFAWSGGTLTSSNNPDVVVSLHEPGVTTSAVLINGATYGQAAAIRPLAINADGVAAVATAVPSGVFTVHLFDMATASLMSRVTLPAGITESDFSITLAVGADRWAMTLYKFAVGSASYTIGGQTVTMDQYDQAVFVSDTGHSTSTMARAFSITDTSVNASDVTALTDGSFVVAHARFVDTALHVHRVTGSTTELDWAGPFDGIGSIVRVVGCGRVAVVLSNADSTPGSFGGWDVDPPTRGYDFGNFALVVRGGGLVNAAAVYALQDPDSPTVELVATGLSVSLSARYRDASTVDVGIGVRFDSLSSGSTDVVDIESEYAPSTTTTETVSYAGDIEGAVFPTFANLSTVGGNEGWVLGQVGWH